MQVTIFGATGPTGRLLCHEAVAAGHQVRAVSRQPGPSLIGTEPAMTIVHADAATGRGVAEAVDGADAVLSALGASYSRRPISVYSAGTHNIIEAIRNHASGQRLVVVSAGLTYQPPPMNWFADHLLFPFLRNGPGRTLYADMQRMEAELRTASDIDWTVLRPGRLFDADSASAYRVDPDAPTQGYTSRIDLATAMVAELCRTDHIHQAISPTTDRKALR